MFDQVKQLMEMKKKADQIKRELDSSSIEVNEVNGIKMTITGAQDFKSIEIDEGLLNAGNRKRFENDLLRSVNAAIKKSQNLAATKMKAVMPNLPGM
ncbi:MAG: YbaB/EbfC family nucleoid-associated protein [Candidatus Omnitrophica bacterium]|nr:YbaB/EbfC family nucleoid-associated protein [Candidatus Omnitrophota bacterium]MBU1997548.1 YbaB/EbfC family nucleoid-associated protein [Candidatus Omnitrophota bacterium]MBU4333665.1 YbaB/EbfC family nucleoid-associated protein [Candidatus Omnitrophota bacterium]